MSFIVRKKKENSKGRMSYKFINERAGTSSKEARDGVGGGCKIKISKKMSCVFKKRSNENLVG